MATKQVSEVEIHGAGAAADGLGGLVERLGTLAGRSPATSFRMNRDV